MFRVVLHPVLRHGKLGAELVAVNGYFRCRVCVVLTLSRCGLCYFLPMVALGYDVIECLIVKLIGVNQKGAELVALGGECDEFAL